MNPIVITPAFDRILPEVENGLRKLEKDIPVWRLFGHSDIARCRSVAASQSLHDGYDKLLWIDADVAFDPADALAMIERDLPYVCGLYVVKSAREFAFDMIDTSEPFTLGTDALLEINYGPMGFTAIDIEAFDAVGEQLDECQDDRATFKPYFLPMVHDGRYLAEDYAFCERLSQAGIDRLAWLKPRLSHIGNYGYSWEDAADEPLKRYQQFSVELNRNEQRTDESD